VVVPVSLPPSPGLLTIREIQNRYSSSKKWHLAHSAGRTPGSGYDYRPENHEGEFAVCGVMLLSRVGGNPRVLNIDKMSLDGLLR